MGSLRAAAGAALVAVVLVGAASPASAHAILLRTDPTPQTTVARPPETVRLFFSEAVEAAFGAVRVFDVDGHRVDSGPIHRADGNRQVSVGVHTRDGTYTVTWRVTSADGHAVHGGFGFYVGAPSSISAVAIPTDQGAGWTVTWGFGAVRFAWFGALCALVGLVVVRRWIWTPSLRAAGLATSSAAGARFKRWFGPGMVGGWIVLAVAGAFSLVFQTASVSGLTLAASARPSALAETLGSAFGHFWEARMVLVAVGALPVFALVRRRSTFGASPSVWIGVGGVVAGGLCVVSALDGHARTLGRTALDVPSLALHLGAVTVWIGGLAALVVVGGSAWSAVAADTRATLARHLIGCFGRVAAVAAAVLVVTGVVNAFGDFGAVSDLWKVAYGRVVAAKVVLLAVALLLAARHRWVVRPRLAGGAGPDDQAAVRSFRWSGLVEAVILLVAVALGAALVAMVPGKSLALAANGPVNQEHRAGSYTVQLVIDPTSVGPNQVHVSWVNAQGLGAAEVTTTDVALGRAAARPAPVEMRLISPGHFVGDATLAAPGTYRLSVATAAGSSDSTAFTFKVRGSGQK